MQTKLSYTLAAITALSIATTVATPTTAHAQPSYGATVVGLGVATGISGGTIVGATGIAGSVGNHALLWSGTPPSSIDLHPIGFPFGSPYSFATGVSASTQVGYWYVAGGSNSHALLWNGTAASAIDLTPPGFLSSGAYGVSGNTQVGYGDSYALLWQGTATSVVNLHPTGLGFLSSVATGVSGNTQVGYGYKGSSPTSYHALLWQGTAASVVDLHPTGLSRFDTSYATGVSGNTQVGYGYVPQIGYRRALLWHGTAASAIELTPPNTIWGIATAVSGNIQVGSGSVGTDFFAHALLWRGTVASVVNLHTSLTGLTYNGSPITFTSSEATGVDTDGTVVGIGTTSTGAKYVLKWSQLPLTITNLSPGYALKSSGATTNITVTGISFVSGDTVQFNGIAVPTTFVSNTQLTATVPIGTAGTFPVRVVRNSGEVTGSLNFDVLNPATANCTGAIYQKNFFLTPSTITATLANTGELSAVNLANLAGKLYTTKGVLVATLNNGIPSATIIPSMGSVSVVYNIPSRLTLPAGTYTFTPLGTFAQQHILVPGYVTGSATITVP
jgi:hypothetical protein